MLLCLPGLTGVRAGTPQPFLLNPERDMVELGQQVDYLADPSGRLTIAEVSGPTWGEHFRPLPGGSNSINFGYSPHVYWLRFTLANAAPTTAEWWLEIGYFSLEHITLYPPQSQPTTTGHALSFAQRPIPHRYFVIPLQVDERPATFYLQVRSAGSLTIPLRLWRPAAFAADSASGYAAMALYYGALAALLLYNLLLYLSLRERCYLVYCLFVTSMAGAQLALTGFGNQYLWTDWAFWNRIGSDVGFSAAGLFGLSSLIAVQGTRWLDHSGVIGRARWAESVFVALQREPIPRPLVVLADDVQRFYAIGVAGLSWRLGIPESEISLQRACPPAAGRCLRIARDGGWSWVTP